MIVNTMVELDDKEQEELKTLQEERKGQHISDSNRTRLSQLLAKEGEGKEGEGKEPAAGAAKGGTTGGAAKAPAGKLG